ncbi:MAG: hypothetical protein IPH10_04595 [bacterium]|nr:hypothetical protein [bacterium]
MRFASILFALVLVVSGAQAVVPTTMTYQGIFTDLEGNVMPDGVYEEVGFHIMHSAVGGPPVWSEWQDITISNGVFEVILGTWNPLAPADFLDPQGDGLWLSISYNDTWMNPRQPISSVPFAFIACVADTARNLGVHTEASVSQFQNTTDARLDVLEAAESGMFSENAAGGVVGETLVAFNSGSFGVGGPASIMFFAQVINDGLEHAAWKARLRLQHVGSGVIVSQTDYEFRADGNSDIHLQKTFPNGVGVGTYRLIVEVTAIDGQVDVDDIEFGAMWISSGVVVTGQ